VSGLIWAILAQGKPERFFENELSGLWGRDVFGGLRSFVLTWTLFLGEELGGVREGRGRGGGLVRK